MPDSQEPKEQDFTKEFTRIASETILRQYEAKNRERINSASLVIRDAFDQQWEKVTGKRYYLPVTTQPMVAPAVGKNNTQRTNPQSRKYLSAIVFSKIIWNKIPRRRIGKHFKDLYNLKGVEQGTNDERPIYMNMDTDRLAAVLGIGPRDQIIADAKSSDHGEIEGEFNLDVEGYWMVQFSPQMSKNDPRDVPLMWEGQCLMIQRMKEVVLPGFYIEVADNALLDNYTETPEEGRKKIGTIQRFPYTVIREATRQEYLEQKAEGDKIQRESLLRQENK